MTNTKTFVRQIIRSSVNHNGAFNPYHFFKNQWIEIHERDIPYYTKRAVKNVGWEIRQDEVVPTELHYFVRFMGVGAKKKQEEKTTKIKRYESDARGNVLPETIREYEFPMEKWIEIDELDKAFFKVKADSNEHWEYEKRIVPIKAKVKAKPKMKEKVPDKPDGKIDDKDKKPPVDPPAADPPVDTPTDDDPTKEDAE